MDDQKIKENSYTGIKQKRPVFVVLGIAIALTAILGVVMLFKPDSSKQAKITPINPDAVIITVGGESIYKKDLDYEISSAPKPLQDNPKTIESLTTKLINDSVTLQQGNKEKIVELGSLSYNNSSKDYALRLREINKIKRTVNARAERLEGTIVSIWFFNSIIPKIGIQEAKEIVKAKINNIHAEVKSKRLTVDQAIERIKADTSLSEIDGAYISNAGYKFSATREDKITVDKEFDNKLWILNEGDISEVHELKDLNRRTGQLEPVLYSFGSIAKRAATGNAVDYDKWLEESSKLYAVTKY